MPAKKTKKGSGSGKDLKDKLALKPRMVWDQLTEKERIEVFKYAKGYMDFLDNCKSERLAIREMLEKAKEKGFVDLESKARNKRGFFHVMRSKALALAIPGKRPMTEGMRLIASHVDCPRLDLKANPLYEDTDLAFLKTHYYGGIKKYHWVARQLALIGTVILKNGSKIDVSIGLDEDDPIFTIPDLLPHLGKKHMDKKAKEFIPAENLNALIGSIPYEDEEADQRVKLAILDILYKKHKILEEDFTSAELEFVPAETARDVGLDRSLIGAYGQDDRVCAYTSFSAMMETNKPEYTCLALFYDKEEIGSEGNTGARTRYLEMFLLNLMAKLGEEANSRTLNQVLYNTMAFSADVNAAFDPTYADVFEKSNACKIGYGVVIEKYTGSGGKYGASDAHAEYMGLIRRLCNENNIVWQTGGHGKVDEGGGGTVAKFLAMLGMEIIDIGPAVLSMHSPFEITSKADVWMCHKVFKTFLNSK
jgi:aspartyl aminopeptidase